jgi:hypothetical protein
MLAEEHEHFKQHSPLGQAQLTQLYGVIFP